MNIFTSGDIYKERLISKTVIIIILVHVHLMNMIGEPLKVKTLKSAVKVID